jgi:hexosaminidase
MRNIKVKSLHLDTARSFIPIEELYVRVKELSDLGYTHLQLGLSDDQGWRFESKKYPLLHINGGYRDREILTSTPHKEIPKDTYGGYYTQDQLKDLISYAGKLSISIIPLVNIPGHSSAAIYSYPELNSGGTLKGVPHLKGAVLYKSRTSTICYTNEFTKTWVKDIYDELMNVFTGSYIHLGFDEIAHGECPRCKKCNAESLNDLLKLAYNTVLSRGRKPIIWWRKEKGSIDIGNFPELTIQWWGAASVYPKDKIYNDIIFSQPSVLYFDYPQEVGDRIVILDDMGTALVHPYGLIAKVAKFPPNVIGVGACVWTENLINKSLRDDHLFPRLNILSDILKGIKVPPPVHPLGSWISSSYVSRLVDLVRDSKLPYEDKDKIRNVMNTSSMANTMSFLALDYPSINFKSIPLSRVSKSVINTTSKEDWEFIQGLYN